MISAMPSQKNGVIVRQVIGYDRFVGEHASAATHRTVPRVATVPLTDAQPSMKLLSKQRDGKKSALHLRCSQDPAGTVASVRRPAGPEAASTDRGGTHARPFPSLPTTRAVATGRLPLCCQLRSFRFKHPICSHSRLFRRTLYNRTRSHREERYRSGNRVPYPVPRAGEGKTHPGLAALSESPP
jgi:hypothetical protein